MKKTLINFNIGILFVTLFLGACTSSTQLQMLQPAEMKLPSHLQVVATVDRSKPGKGIGSFLEGMITGENIGQDEDGRARTFEGLSHTLTQTPRFQVRHTGIVLRGSKKVNQFAAPIPWEEVERISKSYGADALAVIEKFDSDSYTNTTEHERTKKDKEGNKYVETYYNSTLVMDATIGFRLYDWKKKMILDQVTINRSGTFRGTGSTPEEALNDLPSPNVAIQDVGYEAGMEYAMRIAPTWVTEMRNFYKKGKGDTKDAMKKAAKYAQNGDWDRASNVWKDILAATPDKKTAGRAAMNLAVAAERLERFDLALEWAKRALYDFDNKQAAYYVGVLNRRINDKQLVKYQMEEG